MNGPISACPFAGAAQGVAPVTVDANTVIIDARTPEEYAEGHVYGAVNYDFYANDFETKIDEFSADKNYLIHCGAGSRAAKAIEILAEAGITNVQNTYSLQETAEATGLPVVK